MEFLDVFNKVGTSFVMYVFKDFLVVTCPFLQREFCNLHLIRTSFLKQTLYCEAIIFFILEYFSFEACIPRFHLIVDLIIESSFDVFYDLDWIIARDICTPPSANSFCSIDKNCWYNRVIPSRFDLLTVIIQVSKNMIILFFEKFPCYCVQICVDISW